MQGRNMPASKLPVAVLALLLLSMAAHPGQ
jgi:hypothetical protein